MRVATYNIKHASLKGLDAIADTLRPLGADLIALQEVDRGVARSGGADQPSLLARLLGLSAVFGPAFPLEGGEYGVCLLTRLPVRAATVHHLPSASDVPLADGVEPRVALEVRVGDLTVVVAHLGLDPAERLRQADTLLARLAQTPRVLLVGDLNCEPGDPAFSRLLGPFCDGLAALPARATFPADRPELAIDHVLVSRDLPAPRAAERVVSDASDHLPVVADLW